MFGVTRPLTCSIRMTVIASGDVSHLQRHQRTKPRPQYGSRQMATSREGYNSHWSFIERQKALVAVWDIWEDIKNITNQKIHIELIQLTKTKTIKNISVTLLLIILWAAMWEMLANVSVWGWTGFWGTQQISSWSKEQKNYTILGGLCKHSWLQWHNSLCLLKTWFSSLNNKRRKVPLCIWHLISPAAN